MQGVREVDCGPCKDQTVSLDQLKAEPEVQLGHLCEQRHQFSKTGSRTKYLLPLSLEELVLGLT